MADLQLELAEQLAEDIRARGGIARAIKVDVRNFSVMQQLLSDVVMESGRIDYIFNNAGILFDGTIEHYEIKDWNQIIDINLHGVISRP